MITRCFKIIGRVQGVFFRDSTQRKATGLGLTGSAINLADGSVRVIAQGNEAEINELLNWLQVGPEMSVVERVDEVDIGDDLEFNDFTVG
ncbi:MAG: acylphosphatase [Gammaproteobacteria bacterium]|jgi:acylphosphatase|nr:acylphosphatase [Gammaproteobacteria bacterium]|tara:strand:+ start:1671 stop:1940 length:270 start_codon:yes stop_codon:yes gene_type:complete